MALSNHPNVLGRSPTAQSLQIGNVDGPATGGSTDNALVRWDGTTGRLIQNGVVTEADFTGTLTGAADQATTTAVGVAFTNQPANDGVEVLSSNAGDTTQTVTIIGTTNGTDTVVVETVTLNGTTAVATVKANWGLVLAVKKSAATLGTVTVREASADLTITAGLTAAVLSVGVATVSNTAAFNRAISAVASGATTKQLGFQGTNSSGTVIYDSKALNGTTAITSNSSFLTLTEIYIGDLEVTRTATVTTNGGWTLTGGGGGTLSFDTLTGGITQTPSGSGRNVSAGPLRITGTSVLSFGATANATIGVTADTTAGVMTFTSPAAAGEFRFVDSAGSRPNITLYYGGSEKLRFDSNSGSGIIRSISSLEVQTNGSNSSILISGGSAATITGGAGNMVITSGTGNSRTMALQTTTSGGAATNAIVINDVQNSAFSGSITAVNLATASAPAYAKGVIYFDTTLNKLRVGGAAAFETITSA